MSQKKVEAYKEYKKNKDKILKKEKRMRNLELGVIALVGVAFVGWFGYSVYDSAQKAAKEYPLPNTPRRSHCTAPRTSRPRIMAERRLT